MKAAKQENSAAESQDESLKPVRRLCNEIQLFDLCDLNQCLTRDGRFCTSEELLTRFERIADEETPARVKPDLFSSEEDDNEPGFDEEYDDDQDDYYDEDDSEEQDEDY